MPPHPPQVTALLTPLAPGILEHTITFEIGATTQGLATPASDVDHAAIYAPPRAMTRALAPLPEQWHSDDRDTKTYRADKYARALVKGNPDIVELTVRTPVARGGGRGADFITDLLAACAPLAVTRAYARSSAGHLGRVVRLVRVGAHLRDERRAQQRGKRAALGDKFVFHGIRIGLHAQHVIRTGTRLEGFSGAEREQLLAAKTGAMPFAEVTAWLEALAAELLGDDLTLRAGLDAHLPDTRELEAAIEAHFERLWAYAAPAPAWQAVTPPALHASPDGPLWLARFDGTVELGTYTWRQGDAPDRLATRDGDGDALDGTYTHFTPALPPPPPGGTP